MTITWLTFGACAARCEARGMTRAAARRLATFALPPPTWLRERAAALAAGLPEVPGRVQAAGSFTDPELVALIASRLPVPLGGALHPQFEWYGCRGAHFHNDAHYPDVLFGAWCLAGPARDLLFPRTGWRVACAIGTIVIFDPFEPHALLDVGQTEYRAETYVHAAASMFVAFELALDQHAKSAFGVEPSAAGGELLSSGRAVHAETGKLA